MVGRVFPDGTSPPARIIPGAPRRPPSTERRRATARVPVSRTDALPVRHAHRGATTVVGRCGTRLAQDIGELGPSPSPSASPSARGRLTPSDDSGGR